MKRPLFATLGIVLVGVSSHFFVASSANSAEIVVVKNGWVRATVAQQKVTGAFMQLTAQKDVRLVDVRSSFAESAEIHTMSMTNNVMRMHAVDGIDLPAGKTVDLKPGAYHVMLFALKQQVKVGDLVPLTLIVEGKGKQREVVELNLPVRALDAGH